MNTNTNTPASLQEVTKFLLGQGPLRGFWFGEQPKSETAKFWWRRDLIDAIAGDVGAAAP